MSQLGFLLQEPVTTTTTQTESRTILGLLREEQMDSLDDLPRRRRRSFKERLGFIGFGCCGTTWGFRSSSSSAQLSQNIQQQSPDMDIDTGPGQDPNMCLGLSLTAPTSSGSGSSSMNLAAALAAERQLRGAGQTAETVVGVGRMPGTPWRVSLMRLLEETENGDTVAVVSKVAEDKVCSVAGNDSVCCVCMGRNKGAAFIPCGHTFCRVCSRELWLNRGSCPLCNRSIIEILDIF